MATFRVGNLLKKPDLRERDEVVIRRLGSTGALVPKEAKGRVEINDQAYSFTDIIDAAGNFYEELVVQSWDGDRAVHASGTRFEIYAKAEV